MSFLDVIEKILVKHGVDADYVHAPFAPFANGGSVPEKELVISFQPIYPHEGVLVRIDKKVNGKYCRVGDIAEFTQDVSIHAIAMEILDKINSIKVSE